MHFNSDKLDVLKTDVKWYIPDANVIATVYKISQS